MFAQKFLISAFLLAAAAAVPASASLVCTTGNPCTGSSATGADTTDRTNFGTDNSDLSFSNITFDSATGTYTAAGGLNGTTAPGASLFGVSFIGCFSFGTPCSSNSIGVGVGNVTNWGGGSNPALLFNATPIAGGNLETFTITLPANTYAFALDLISQNNLGTPFNLSVDGGSKTTANSVSVPGSVFFGFRSATPISSVSVFSGFQNEQIELDNFEIGTAVAPVAESKTLLLVGSGLFMLLYVRRRMGTNLRMA
jgi:hypothetical protein